MPLKRRRHDSSKGADVDGTGYISDDAEDLVDLSGAADASPSVTSSRPRKMSRSAAPHGQQVADELQASAMDLITENDHHTGAHDDDLASFDLNGGQDIDAAHLHRVLGHADGASMADMASANDPAAFAAAAAAAAAAGNVDKASASMGTGQGAGTSQDGFGRGRTRRPQFANRRSPTPDTFEIKDLIVGLMKRLNRLEKRFDVVDEGQDELEVRVELTQVRDAVRGVQATHAILSAAEQAGINLHLGPPPPPIAQPPPQPLPSAQASPLGTATSTPRVTRAGSAGGSISGKGASSVPKATKDSDIENELGLMEGSLFPFRLVLTQVHQKLQSLPDGDPHKMDLGKKFTDGENHVALEHFIDEVIRQCDASPDERLHAFRHHRGFVRSAIHKKYNHWHSNHVKSNPQKEFDLQANRRRSRIGRKYTARRTSLLSILPESERDVRDIKLPDTVRPEGDPTALAILKEAISRYNVVVDHAQLMAFVNEKSCHSEEDTADEDEEGRRVSQADQYVRPVQPSWRTEAGSAVFRELDRVASIKRKHQFVGRAYDPNVPFPSHLQGIPYVDAQVAVNHAAASALTQKLGPEVAAEFVKHHHHHQQQQQQQAAAAAAATVGGHHTHHDPAAVAAAAALNSYGGHDIPAHQALAAAVAAAAAQAQQHANAHGGSAGAPGGGGGAGTGGVDDETGAGGDGGGAPGPSSVSVSVPVSGPSGQDYLQALQGLAAANGADGLGGLSHDAQLLVNAATQGAFGHHQPPHQHHPPAAAALDEDS